VSNYIKKINKFTNKFIFSTDIMYDSKKNPTTPQKVKTEKTKNRQIDPPVFTFLKTNQPL